MVIKYTGKSLVIKIKLTGLEVLALLIITYGILGM